ncbi:hypothetical protein [Stappia sp. ICDLI1TA098]
MRSLTAAARAAERESMRRQKERHKQRVFSDAVSAVEDWEDLIERLTSVHVFERSTVDWQRLATLPPPVEPVFSNEHLDRAENALRVFRPRFYHFFKGGSKRLQARLVSNFEVAAQVDQEAYEQALQKYSKDLADWQVENDFAKMAVSGEVETLKKILEELTSLTRIEFLGEQIDYNINTGFIQANLYVNDKDVVPNFRRKVLSSGRLSESRMPDAQRNEIYQDHVCGAALRVSGELFSSVPVDEILVNCMAQAVNKSNGRMERVPILSVHFVRETFCSLKMDTLDPSEAMQNFRHVMAFSRSKGFSTITPLEV